ncbi:hypothetical protein Tco_0312978 [Tanacetum coccineum]
MISMKLRLVFPPWWGVTDCEVSGDREVQRTMLQLLNQLDGFIVIGVLRGAILKCVPASAPPNACAFFTNILAVVLAVCVPCPESSSGNSTFMFTFKSIAPMLSDLAPIILSLQLDASNSHRPTRRKVTDVIPLANCRDHGPQPSPVYSYCFKAIVSEGTTTISITCFSSKANTLTKDCNELEGTKKEHTEESTPAAEEECTILDNDKTTIEVPKNTIRKALEAGELHKYVSSSLFSSPSRFGISTLVGIGSIMWAGTYVVVLTVGFIVSLTLYLWDRKTSLKEIAHDEKNTDDV